MFASDDVAILLKKPAILLEQPMELFMKFGG